MLSRREFVAVLGALPVVRLLPGVRLGCHHRWGAGFETHKKAGFSTDRGGPLHEWVFGHQCLDCGHIKVAERVTIRWGRILP